jgi:hypothetical protein
VRRVHILLHRGGRAHNEARALPPADTQVGVHAPDESAPPRAPAGWPRPPPGAPAPGRAPPPRPTPGAAPPAGRWRRRGAPRRPRRPPAAAARPGSGSRYARVLPPPVSADTTALSPESSAGSAWGGREGREGARGVGGCWQAALHLVAAGAPASGWLWGSKCPWPPGAPPALCSRPASERRAGAVPPLGKQHENGGAAPSQQEAGAALPRSHTR